MNSYDSVVTRKKICVFILVTSRSNIPYTTINGPKKSMKSYQTENLSIIIFNTIKIYGERDVIHISFVCVKSYVDDDDVVVVVVVSNFIKDNDDIDCLF